MRRRLTKIRHKNFMLTSAVSRFINAKRRTASCGFLALFFMTEQVAPTPSSRLPGCFVQVFSANNFLCFISNHTDKLSPVFGRPQGSPCQAYSTQQSERLPQSASPTVPFENVALSLSHFQQIEQHPSVAVDLATSPFNPTCSIKF